MVMDGLEKCLEDLIYQGTIQTGFCPKVHLFILTDSPRVSGPLCLTITDFVHTCLLNYFLPHRDAVSVSWIQRKLLKEHMIARLLNTQSRCVGDYLDMVTGNNLNMITAVLFASADAITFMMTHKDSLLPNLAVCLNTSSDKILIFDMAFNPFDMC